MIDLTYSHFFNGPLIMACHLTGVHDVNRNTVLKDDDFELIRGWAESIAALKMHGLIFHNNFSEETCSQHQSEHLLFLKVAHDTAFNPNVYRYIVYRDFLKKHSNEIESVFVTDVSDVVVLNNPFQQPLFKNHPNALFCGDEPKPLGNEWMDAHSAHLRSKIADYAAFETKFKAYTLLNCGIIGGRMEVMRPFIEKLALLHEAYNFDNTTAYTGDMGAFNYLVRTQYQEQVLHGQPVNTVFKAYETGRKDCWFSHK